VSSHWIGASVAAVIVLGACASDPASVLSATGPAVPTDPPLSTVSSTTMAEMSTPDTEFDSKQVTTIVDPSEATPVEIEITELCSESADVIVEALLREIQVGETSAACVRPALRTQLAALEGSSFNIEMGLGATWTENPILGTTGWIVHVALDFFDEDGSTTREVQQWALVPDDDEGLIVDTIDVIATEQVVTEGEAVVLNYLNHLAGGRFEEAAQLLGQGGQDWSERIDLAVFPESPRTQEDLAEALRRWCTSGGRCTKPTSLTARPTVRGTAAEVTATWQLDHGQATATLIGRNYEGAPAVSGLPPLTADAAGT